MKTSLATRPSADGIERVLLEGDLGGLSSEQRITYYQRVCESVGLNPLTVPFEYLKLQGKTILYAKRGCTDQLRQIHKVSVVVTARERTEGVYVVTARATTPDGRCDESIGAVPVEGLKGEAYANALMKAETKAKRRVTLAICGLSILDETELSGVTGAIVQPVPDQRVVTSLPRPAQPRFDAATGEIEPATAAPEVEPDLSPADQVKMLVDVDLSRCVGRESLVAWARELHAIPARAQAKEGAWKAWATRCGEAEFAPAELAAEARKAP